MNIWSYREAGVGTSAPSWDETSIALNLQTDGTKLYWLLGIRAYKSVGGGYYWDDTYHNWTQPNIPLGQWYHLEVYIVRSTSEPVIKVWGNEDMLWNLDKNNMFTLHNILGEGKNSFVYDYTDPYNPNPYTSRGISTKFYIKALVFYSGEGSYDAPCYYWIDDIELRNGFGETSGIDLTVTSPINTTYGSGTITVTMSAMGGTIDTLWFNFKTGGSWVYGSNQTYTATIDKSGFSDGAYTFYGWANNTDGYSDEELIVFTVTIATYTTGGAWWGDWWG
jgi:hypothetical protein